MFRSGKSYFEGHRIDFLTWFDTLEYTMIQSQKDGTYGQFYDF